jgi:hypothetical protein
VRKLRSSHFLQVQEEKQNNVSSIEEYRCFDIMFPEENRSK